MSRVVQALAVTVGGSRARARSCAVLADAALNTIEGASSAMTRPDLKNTNE
jgi:hypothetical protein